MHRQILKTPAHLFTDHINGNGIDNRRANLRVATPAQNAQWAPRRKRESQSGYIGVHWAYGGLGWVATITADGKEYWLGTYESVIDAAIARDLAALRLHGQFAVLNFPDITPDIPHPPKHNAKGVLEL
jgi:hypothetical protein